jgi:hypothetical protein
MAIEKTADLHMTDWNYYKYPPVVYALSIYIYYSLGKSPHIGILFALI